MTNIKIHLIILVLFTALCLNFKISSKNKNNLTIQNQSKNLIINGDFEIPNVNNWQTLLFLHGWKSTDVKVGLGTIYNSVWEGSGQVLELDTSSNVEIEQNFNLEKAFYCSFKIDYASKYLRSDKFSVEFNGKVIANLESNDGRKHTYENTNLVCNAGENTLKIKGTGNPDGYGMTIDNVQMYTHEEFVDININDNDC